MSKTTLQNYIDGIEKLTFFNIDLSLKVKRNLQFLDQNVIGPSLHVELFCGLVPWATLIFFSNCLFKYKAYSDIIDISYRFG